MTTNFRVHFRTKQEFRYVEDDFQGGGLFAEHPLLGNLRESSTSVFISRPFANVTGVLAEIRAVTQRWSQGWRVAEEYLNEHAWPEDLAEAGYGLLMCGPQSLGSQCVVALKRMGCHVSTVAGHAGSTEPHQVIVFGRSFVIAESFVVETTDNNGLQLPT